MDDEKSCNSARWLQSRRASWLELTLHVTPTNTETSEDDGNSAIEASYRIPVSLGLSEAVTAVTSGTAVTVVATLGAQPHRQAVSSVFINLDPEPQDIEHG